MGIVKEKADNRRVIQAAESINNVAIGPERPSDKIEKMLGITLELTSSEKRQQVGSVAEDAMDVLDEVFANKTGLKTGFDVLDWHLG